MELAMPRDDEGPEFFRVTKRLRDANRLPIGTENDNPLLDTRINEVEYQSHIIKVDGTSLSNKEL